MKFFKSYSILLTSVSLFIISFYSFTLSVRPFNTTDSYPNNLVSLNYIFKKRLDLTNLYKDIKDREIEGIVVVNNEGLVYPKTPVLLGILNIPGFYIFNNIYGVYNLTPYEMVFNDYQQYIGKYLASIYTSLSAVFLFIFLNKLFKSIKISLISTLTYIFATNVFNTASQANWQHGISLMFITLLLNILVKQKKYYLDYLLSGALLVLLWQIRISNLLYATLVITTLFNSYNPYKFNKKHPLFFIFGGLLIYLPLYYLNYLLEIPYGYESAIGLALTRLSPISFFGVIFSILFSINFGLFTYSPVLLLSVVSIKKVIKVKKDNFQTLFLKRSLVVIILFLIFAGIWPYWTGGTSLGYRMLTESLPIWIMFIGYFLINYKRRIWRILFYALFLLSFFINLLTTYTIDGWWYSLYTIQTAEGQIRDAWFTKPSLFEYLLKTRVIYFETFKKKDNKIISEFVMIRPTVKTRKIETLLKKETEIINLNKN